jgi:hypothetical protein
MARPEDVPPTLAHSRPGRQLLVALSGVPRVSIDRYPHRMVCPTCGLANDPAATTCARCGTVLTAAGPMSTPAAGGPPVPMDNGPPSGLMSKAPIIAAVAVAVILLATAGIGFLLYQNRGAGDAGERPAIAQPTQPRPAEAQPADRGTSETEQVAAIDAVLTQSVASRRKLNQAIDRVRRCAELDRAVADMRAVGDERRQQIDTVGSAAVDRMPGGERMRTTLTEALRQALAADEGYLAWAEPTTTERCGDTAARRAAFRRGEAASTKAGAAKSAFLTLWNPVATDMGLPARNRQDI